MRKFHSVMLALLGMVFITTGCSKPANPEPVASKQCGYYNSEVAFRPHGKRDKKPGRDRRYVVKRLPMKPKSKQIAAC